MVDTAISTPLSKNFLSPLGFKFSLKRAPNLVFNVQKATFPGVNLGVVDVPTPFSIIPLGGKIFYPEFSLQFLVDEDLNNYLEIYNWMIGVGFPREFEQHKALSDQPKFSGTGLVSDMNLTILTSTSTPNISVDFIDAFPIRLSDLIMSTTEENVNYIESTVSFRYQRHEITKL